MVLFITKPQIKNITETKFIDNPCPYEQLSYDGKKQCDASEACKKQGGRLKHFKDTFGNAPQFECEYNK